MWWVRSELRDRDTYELRIGMYERRVRAVDRFGVGLGGIVLLISAQLASAPPDAFIGAITLTLALLDGGALGLAYLGFDYEATRLRRALLDGIRNATSVVDEDHRRWPRTPECIYVAAVFLLVATTVAFEVGVWTSV
jgi:hypothetical protein